MHYVRFLRAPKLSGRNRLQVELLFTITTDLGDSFLWPQKFFGLQVIATATSELGTSSWLLSNPGKLFWEPGMRVAKPTLELPGSLQMALESGQAKVEICVRAAESSHSADGAGIILAVPMEKPKYRNEAAQIGLVMPAWVALNVRRGDTEVCTRKLHLGEPGDGLGYVEIEEEIGESIARHIWDAGAVALCAIAGISTLPEYVTSQHACMTAIQGVLNSQTSPQVLELGCGVGILGVGLASIYPKLRSDPSARCTILMTDLEEAEGRARSNIDLLDHGQLEPPVRMLYENLDWEDGRRGRFGNQVKSKLWDLIMLSDCTYNVDMLPALVETLSALHSSNLTHVHPAQPFSTKVFLATKPRHESEQALFDLMFKDGWDVQHQQVIPLPVLGAQPESVEMYLFQKSRSGDARNTKHASAESNASHAKDASKDHAE